METLLSVARSLVLPAWASFIGLKNAYLHIPIRTQDSQFLHFIYDGTVYEFTTLPFGLSTSPRVFTQVVKTIAAYLRRHNALIFQYQDD